MISLGIAATVLSSVFGSFLFLARSSLLSTAYSGMDSEARRGLEIFAREVRMAKAVSNFTENGLTLTVPTSLTTEYQVSFSYDPTTKTFYKNRGTATEQALIRGVEVFILRRYSLLQDPVTGEPIKASNDISTKQIQVQLRAVRSAAARATATNNVISARYILRNKIVTN